ncbi:protein tipE-like [Schistocerca nitens]|uniref:protein tipE-like n=1 Tax=Schistocerca nitens TaxID=7011 RepID=UPI00211854AA|nr:protein tipE-like [Schistocerca nitens]
MDPEEATMIMGEEGGGGGGGLEPAEEIPEVKTLLQKAKFYTSLCLGTTAVLSVFGFLFLIPFVVDPAISAIVSDYESEAVTCATVEHVYAEGLRNCSWASCREGCTTAPPRCHQILVNYSREPYAAGSARNFTPLPNWDVVGTRFFINTEGCGYPPSVNCSVFAKKFRGDGDEMAVKQPFPCYFSRAYPEMVVARYDWDENLRHLILALVVPTLLFGVSVGVLAYWYCPGCRRLCHKPYREKYTPKDEDMEEDDDFFDEGAY